MDPKLAFCCEKTLIAAAVSQVFAGPPPIYFPSRFRHASHLSELTVTTSVFPELTVTTSVFPGTD